MIKKGDVVKFKEHPTYKNIFGKEKIFCNKDWYCDVEEILVKVTTRCESCLVPIDNIIQKDFNYICKVCGKDFKLKKDNKYIVQENKGINGIASGSKKFECFDCPNCGCQNIVNVREG